MASALCTPMAALPPADDFRPLGSADVLTFEPAAPTLGQTAVSGETALILSAGGIAVTALDLTAPLCVVSLALLLLIWGGYVTPGSYVPRFVAAATLDGGHGITVRCPRLDC